MVGEKYGIVDIGSNSMRLVIYEKKTGDIYREIENIKIVARLRNYLTEAKVLNEKGMDVLLESIFRFQEITRFHGVEDVMCVATATIRQAVNKDEISRMIDGYTDFSLQILSEYEEAHAGYTAIMHSTPFMEGITIDIGGGSTEITYFKERELVNYYSFPFGVLSLRQQYVAHNVPSQEELHTIQQYVAEQLGTLAWIRDVDVHTPIIAIGGSARNMVRIDQNMKSYPLGGEHLYEMNLRDVFSVKSHIMSLSFSDLQKQDGLSRERADTISLAIEVFEVLMKIANVQSFFLSRKGLREGVFYAHVHKGDYGDKSRDIREQNIRNFIQDYGVNLDDVAERIKYCTSICNQLEQLHLASFSKEEKDLLRYGSTLYNIGKYIDLEASSQHTFYLLTNQTIDGFMHKERVALALLSSYHSKNTFKRYIMPFQMWFSKDEQKKLRLMGTILRVVSALHATKRDVIEGIEIVQEDDLLFVIWCKKNWLMEQEQVERQKKHLERALKQSISFVFKSSKGE